MERKELSLALIFIISFTILLSFPLNKAFAIKDVWIEVEPNICREAATYKIHFELEKTLNVHEWIKIIFPYDTEFPEKFPSPPKGLCDPQSVIVDYEERSIKFNSHFELNPDIPGYEDIIITIPENLEIKNPSMPGEYTILICTQAEPEPVESKPYKIGEFDSSEIEISVIGRVIGREGYYQEPPEIEIRCTNNKDAQIYHNCDVYNKEFMPYKGKFKLPEGQYITRVTAYGKFERENIGTRSITIKVDSLKPIIRMQQPKEERTVTNSKYFLVKGFTKAQVFKTFGSEKRKIDRFIEIENVNLKRVTQVKTDFKGYFSYDLELTEGENIIIISCEDEAGNRTTTERYIIIRQ